MGIVIPSMNNIVTFSGGPAPDPLIFYEEGTFAAYHAAETHCAMLGLSVGRMCSPKPTGLKYGNWDIAKWNNLTLEDQALMDGVITGDFRNGPVFVFLKSQKRPETIQ